MGYYASGDVRKMVHSSEDDEGYDHQSFYSAVSFGTLIRPDVRNSSCFQHGKRVGISSELTLPASDDSDKSFWAENELSSSESKQQLFKRQKRRRSLSYRNRLAKHRRKSVFFQSSSSSLDSGPGQIPPKVARQKKYNHCTGRFDAGKLQPGCNISKRKFTRNKVIFLHSTTKFPRLKKIFAYTF